MLESLRIENFKCFKTFSDDNLGRMTLIGGHNNAGKTSLLEAIFLILGHKNSSSVLMPYARRGLKSIPHRPEVAWAPLFHNFNCENIITISHSWEGFPRQTLRIRLNKAFMPPEAPGTSVEETKSIPTDSPRILSVALELADAEQEGNRASLFLDPERGPIVYGKQQFGIDTNVGLLARSDRLGKEDSEIFGELDRVGKTTRVMEFVRLIEPKLEALSLNPFGSEHVIHGQLEGMQVKMPIVMMGSGVARLLEIMLGMSQTENGILLIDEIENGIHHSVQAKMWKAIAEAAAELKCQVFATTHSYEFVRHAQEALAGGEYANDFRYIRLERNAKGGHVAKSYDIETVRTAVEMGLEVR